MLKRLTVMGVVLGLIAVPGAVKASAAVRVPANLMVAPFDDPQGQNQTEGNHQGDAQEGAKTVEENDKDLQENDKDLQEDQKDDAEVKSNNGQMNDHDDLNDNDKDTAEDRADDVQEDLQQVTPHRG